MINTIGILPNVFSLASSDKNRERDLDQIWSLFYSNALLSNFLNGYWTEYIHSMKLSREVREKFLIHMTKLSGLHRIVGVFDDVQRKPKSEDDWMTIAIEALKNQQLDAVIAPTNLRVRFGITSENFIDFPVDPFEYQKNVFQPTHTSLVLRNERGLIDALNPIVRFASSVKVIDPYFNCLGGRNEQPYYDALRLVAELLYKNRFDKSVNNRAIKSLEIYTSKDKSGLSKPYHKLKPIFIEKLQNLATTYGIKIELIIMKSIPGNSDGSSKRDVPHDRFLLTDQFGFSLSQGLTLDKEKDERSVVWHLLSEESWKAKLAECTIYPHYPIGNKLFVEPPNEGERNE